MRFGRGVLRVGEREFWLMEEGAWEHHTLTLFDVGVPKPRPVTTLITSSS